MRASFRTEAILLRRVNYGEADRILTLLTPEHGKVSAIAKGIRKSGSKLAGGLELFGVCDITIMPGKRDMGTVTSARLLAFYGDQILRDYDRMQLAYQCVAEINKASQTVAEPELFYLLKDSLQYLGTPGIANQIIEVWFRLRVADLLGVAPNLATDVAGERLAADALYNFDFEHMAFAPQVAGRFGAGHIKFLRLISAKDPAVLRQVSGIDEVMGDCLWFARAIAGA